MSDETSAYVVAIAGPSGAGKTTLVEHVAALLDGATCVFFDDYRATSSYPPDLRAWLEGSADPDLWRTPRLASDVHALRAGAAVTHPDGERTLQPTPYIVIEEPFGRERSEMATAIDFVVVIDLPLEIALARKLRQWLATDEAREQPLAWIADLDDFLATYLEWTWQLYVVVNRRAMTHSDLVVDGTRSIEDLAMEIAAAVRQHSDAKTLPTPGTIGGDGRNKDGAFPT